MKHIRIGNDIAIQWTLFDEEGNPYQVGENIEVWIMKGISRYPLDSMIVVGNVISGEYRGSMQAEPGLYNILLIENPGSDDMISFDKKAIFDLVEHSWEEGGDDPAEIVTEHVNITSEILSGHLMRDFDKIDIDCGTSTTVID